MEEALKRTHEFLSLIRRREGEWIALWEELVNTPDPHGCWQALLYQLERAGFRDVSASRVLHEATRSADGGESGACLLAGHLDLPPGGAVRGAGAFAVLGHRASGPGVADPKGGVVAAVAAIQALEAAGEPDRGSLALALSTDLASAESRELLTSRVAEARWCIELEPPVSSHPASPLVPGGYATGGLQAVVAAIRGEMGLPRVTAGSEGRRGGPAVLYGMGVPLLEGGGEEAAPVSGLFAAAAVVAAVLAFGNRD